MSDAPHRAMYRRIGRCLKRDQFRFRRQLKKIDQQLARGQDVDAEIQRLGERIEASIALLEARRQLQPALNFPEQLPICGRRADIAAAIAEHQVVIVAGETGSGKTTQLPKICLELDRGRDGLIGHTQPRRIAARTVASRIAEELQSPLGDLVGYQVRFHDHSGERSLIKLMTDGILLAEIQRDRYLNRYDTLIIDEAHERSLNIDFLLGYLKQLLPKRPDLKLIVTSATIDVARFSQHFDQAPVIEVSGRTYPVEIEYRPPAEDEDQPAAIANAVEEILGLPTRGDILVFLSGEREIREAAKALRERKIQDLDVLPLYARLSLAEQNRVFQSHRGVRVVLATNVAETSLTVPGIRYVIDTGYARVSRYSYRSKVQRLPIEPISQASANQRAGRCGRLSDGVCLRLYSEEDFLARPEFSDPEIVRTNLAAVILQMLRLRIGDVRDFPFVDPPDRRLINDGFALLAELGGVDPQERLTHCGRSLSQLSVDPRLGRVLLAAAEENCLREALVVVSMLSIQDPRERPADKRQAADEKHRQWADPDSDFNAILKLWEHFEEQRQNLSRNQFAKYCKKAFVSHRRMIEWRDLHHQLHQDCRALKLTDNREPATYPALHRALLSGLLSHIGYRHEAREYLGTRNRKFHVFPGSGLAKKPPQWLVAVELLETSRLFAHHCARIDPAWLPALAAHLVKKSHSEPHYDVRSGRVMAYEKQSLFGLVIVEKQRVEYGRINPVEAREVFIQSALVAGGYARSRVKHRRGHGPFFRHNNEILKALHELEERLRRRDILADERVLFEFYDERVGPEVVGLGSFEHWRRKAEAQQPELLFIDRERLMRHQPPQSEEAQFPKNIHWQGRDYPLNYRFEPGHAEDGVSVELRIEHLHEVPHHRFDWLVPGLLRDKCIALIKALPKQWRKQLVPVPAIVDRVMPTLEPSNQALHLALGEQIARVVDVTVPEDSWAPEQLEDFYRMGFCLRDEGGKVLESHRDLARLRAKYRQRVQAVISRDHGEGLSRGDIRCWDFGELPETTVIKKRGHEIRAYPALIDKHDSVALQVFDNPNRAQRETRAAQVRLAMLQYPDGAKYLRKALFKGQDLLLRAAQLPDRKTLAEDVVYAAYRQACGSGKLPRSAESFVATLEQGKGGIVAAAQELEQLMLQMAEALRELRGQLRDKSGNFPCVVADIQAQLDELLRPDFIRHTSVRWLRRYPRYLLALTTRLDRHLEDSARDRQFAKEVQSLLEQYRELTEQLADQDEAFETELEDFRFMIEEYRVSHFAQRLKTVEPVSAKRLARRVERLQLALRKG